MDSCWWAPSGELFLPYRLWSSLTRTKGAIRRIPVHAPPNNSLTFPGRGRDLGSEYVKCFEALSRTFGCNTNRNVIIMACAPHFFPQRSIGRCCNSESNRDMVCDRTPIGIHTSPFQRVRQKQYQAYWTLTSITVAACVDTSRLLARRVSSRNSHCLSGPYACHKFW